MKYADVVTADNDGEVFLCKLKDGRTLQLQVHDTCEFVNKAVYVLYNFEDSNDSKEYLESDVEEILELVEFDRQGEGNVDWKELETVMIQPNVFAYDTKEDLRQILKWLNYPIVQTNCYTDKTWEEYVQELAKEYGVVFYWTEYDGHSYGDPYSYFCKIIDGVKEF